MKNIKSYQYERDVESSFNAFLSSRYNNRIWAYPNICGSGDSASFLHYEQNTEIIGTNDLFLADMGVRLSNYTTDITVTFPVSGTFTDNQKLIYNIVLNVSKAAAQKLKANIFYSAVQKEATTTLITELLTHSIIKKTDVNQTVDDLIALNIHGLFMPHGLGHLVGLDVHDVGYNSDYAGQMVMQKGNIVTIEPGIYFNKTTFDNALLDTSPLLPYLNKDLINTIRKEVGGIRIEDMFLVTDTTVGNENLSSKMKREVADIEYFMKN